MAYRHYAYQTSEPLPNGRAAFTVIDTTYEDEPQDYIDKFPITIAERKFIDENRADMKIINGELVLEEIAPFDIMLAANWGNQ